MTPIALDRSIEQVLKRVCLDVWRRKILFIFSFAILFSLITYWVLGKPLIYEGTAVLVSGQGAPLQVQELLRKDGDTSSVATFTRIAESDEVVRAAALDLGLVEETPPALSAAASSVFIRLRRAILPGAYEPVVRPSPLASEVAHLKGSLLVRGEQTAGILRISFRDPDPELAAKFANALAARFIERQTKLASRAGAADFFQQQRQRFEQEAAKSAKALQDFSERTNLFSVQEQRQLLLKRRDALSLSVASTKGLVAQKAAERQALANELRKLTPVARSPYVSSLVDSLGGEKTSSRSESRAIDDRSTDSQPLLLVRVYEESMVSLFRANSDLVAAQSLEKQQSDVIQAITRELNVLLGNQEEFNRLKADVDRANQNLELYSKRMIEEQIDAELARARFSSVKILQEAVPSSQPVSPNYPVMTIAAAVLAGIGGAAVTLMFRRSSRVPQHASSARRSHAYRE